MAKQTVTTRKRVKIKIKPKPKKHVRVNTGPKNNLTHCPHCGKKL